jgi:hypothetical protein
LSGAFSRIPGPGPTEQAAARDAPRTSWTASGQVRGGGDPLEGQGLIIMATGAFSVEEEHARGWSRIGSQTAALG